MSTRGSSNSGGGGSGSGSGIRGASGHASRSNSGRSCFSRCFGYAEEIDNGPDDDGLFYCIITYMGGPYNNKRGMLFMR